MEREAIRDRARVRTSLPTRNSYSDAIEGPHLWEAYMEIKTDLLLIDSQDPLYASGRAGKERWPTEKSTEWGAIKPLSGDWVAGAYMARLRTPPPGTASTDDPSDDLETSESVKRGKIHYISRAIWLLNKNPNFVWIH